MKSGKLADTGQGRAAGRQLTFAASDVTITGCTSRSSALYPNVETIAIGAAIREIARLRRRYGPGRWRKRKGIAKVELPDGSVRTAEVHWAETMTRRKLVLCLRNDGYEVSLEPRKIYQLIPDRDAVVHHQLRVVDESGEDYLYPADFFAPIALPPSLRRAVFATA